MDATHQVTEGLRRTLVSSRSAAAFITALESRIRQLSADMVDGRVLPKPEADAVRAAVIELIRCEALPKLAKRSPSDALRLLDKLVAYGFGQLEAERPPLEAARAARFPPPRAATWPELADLRDAARRHPDACSVASPVQNVSFVEDLKGEGVRLFDDLLALYAACDGFDLSCLVASHVPVFSLLPSASIDVCDAEGRYPRRGAVFQGGDEVQLSIYRDKSERWWLVYECEYRPIGKKALDLRELIRFGLGRMNVATVDALHGEHSWERFFGAADG